MKITIDEHWNSWVAGLEEATVPQNVLFHLPIIWQKTQISFAYYLHQWQGEKIELTNYMFHADSISPWSFTFPMALKYDALTFALE